MRMNMTAKRKRNACECGGEMREQTYVHVEQVGAFKVKDGTMQLPQCEKCGNVEITLDELAGYQRRAAAAALREAPKVDGAMVKYARRALGFKQTELAELLGCASETLSRWETDTAPIPRAEQLAIVAILDGVELDAELYDVEPGSPEAFKRAKRRGTALSVRRALKQPHPRRPPPTPPRRTGRKAAA
jgi:transcriptional regulator with XRE-family HTH domain